MQSYRCSSDSEPTDLETLDRAVRDAADVDPCWLKAQTTTTLARLATTNSFQSILDLFV